MVGRRADATDVSIRQKRSGLPPTRYFIRYQTIGLNATTEVTISIALRSPSQFSLPTAPYTLNEQKTSQTCPNYRPDDRRKPATHLNPYLVA